MWAILALRRIENEPGRGVDAASSFESPKTNRFVHSGSDNEAAGRPRAGECPDAPIERANLS